MVARLVSRGAIVSPQVEHAMLAVPRHQFVPLDQRKLAYHDMPLPIGSGQTISAPHMVAIMAEVMLLEPGQKVLEIGTGSGYNAAVIAELIGKDGLLVTMERHRSLADGATKALSEGGYENVRVIVGDGSLGYPEGAPYDRISVTCGAPDVPSSLLEQLKEDGIMIIPVGDFEYQSLLRVRKIGGRAITEDLGSVVFVPLIGEKGHRPSQ